MSRIYAVEPRPGLAGMYADHRVPLRAVDVEGLARALLAEVATRTGGALAATVADRRTALAGAGGRDERLLAALAGDLVKAGPKAAVVVGPRQPKVVHAIAHALHEALGCVGHTVELVPPAVDAVPSGPEALRALCDEMRAGAVETLVITAWNPVYAAPADLDFAGALGKVPHALYLGSHRDETCPHVEWVVPEAHFLESWGDTRSPEGVVALSQPLIAPLFGGVCATELLSLLLPDDAVEATPPSLTAATAAQRATNEPLPPRGQPPVATTELRAQPQAAPAQRPADNRRTWLLLQATWQQILGRGADFQGAWETALQRGTITSWGTAADASPPPAPAPLDHAALAAALRASAPPPGEGLELSFSADPRLYDGRFANNPWLLELPEPSSALTWDNALELSPRTASRLGLSTGGLVEARWHGRTLRVPALVMPGHADDAASITLGWGRQGALRNGAGAGANANALRDSRHFWFGTGLTLAKTGERHPLSFSQEQLDAEGRPVAIELTLSSLLGQPGQLLPERTPLQTLYSPHPYPDHRWGMAIDLARCTGCSACVIACQAENNVPWVGKEQVGRGRIMHWVRVDRYLQGGGGRRIPLPLMCVHCEMAPCEYVCPVNATVHSDEGLNEMVYNRCVGTRYCSNNCPYKVRRFNYFDWHPDARMLPVLRMAQNPDVTVRSRGVMEKCSYCVQRIEEERIESRVAGRPMRSPATACQQTCPTEAIVFGDLNDRSLEVTRRHGSARAYHLLHELNTRPRTAHLARVRNPHPDLPPEPADHA